MFNEFVAFFKKIYSFVYKFNNSLSSFWFRSPYTHSTQLHTTLNLPSTLAFSTFLHPVHLKERLANLSCCWRDGTSLQQYLT